MDFDRQLYATRKWFIVLSLLYALLTHKVLIIVVVGIVDDPMTVPLIESAQSADMIVLGVNGAAALEARLPQALVQAFAEAAPGDLRVELAAETRVPVTLERRVRTPAIGEHVGRRATVRVFRAAR